MKSSRPNILVIQADQLAAKYLGAYGDAIASTPHIDSLAASGATFESAYTNFPLCAPSRFSMMSGQLASTIEAFDNGAEFTSSIPTFAHYLRNLDYQTCLVGKMHFVGADQLHGFEQRLTTDIYPGDFGWTGDWTEVRPKFGNDVVTFTDAGICNGAISYVDDLIGELLAVLKDTGLYDNTLILLTTDHGEMLGEHGLWYKKSFFEEACRIPLIISHPQLGQRRVGANVSLVDLLPTLLEMAGDEQQSSLVDAVAGHSLWGLASGSESVREHPVFAENLAEGATTPLLMVKQGSLKYIHSAVDPKQLFDLETDPQEQVNQFENPDYREARDSLAQLVNQQWDVESLTSDIITSQRRRIFLREALAKGKLHDWDYDPADELEQHCLRADKVYSKWAYQDIVDYRFPKE